MIDQQARLRAIEQKWAIVEPVFGAVIRGSTRLPRGVWFEDPFVLTSGDMHFLLDVARLALAAPGASGQAGGEA